MLRPHNIVIEYNGYIYSNASMPINNLELIFGLIAISLVQSNSMFPVANLMSL